MGGSYCCNYKDKDQHAQNFKEDGKPVFQNVKASRLKEVISEASKHEDRIVHLQANIRGYLQRK